MTEEEGRQQKTFRKPAVVRVRVRVGIHHKRAEFHRTAVSYWNGRSEGKLFFWKNLMSFPKSLGGASVHASRSKGALAIQPARQ